MRLSPSDREELGDVEPFWQAQLAVLFALLLYLALPSRLTLGPGWVLPLFEGVLLIGLAISTPYRHHTQSPVRRRLSIGLIALVTAANFVALGLLVHLLLERNTAAGRDLIIAAGQIWLTNVAVFGLWFWEVDRGGPHMRTAPDPKEPDFLFPQMTVPEMPFGNWRPGFMDYLYVAFTNASAFSPTDAMPLTVRVKSLMLIEAMASFLTVGLIAARAVNILG
jgi:uncharacterized membrane protein